MNHICLIMAYSPAKSLQVRIQSQSRLWYTVIKVVIELITGFINWNYTNKETND